MNSIQSTSLMNLSSALFSGYNTMSNMRLATAMNGKASPIYSPSAAKAATQSLSTGSAAFLNDYRSKMQDMKTSADGVLNPKKSTSGLAAASQDGAVASAYGSLKNQNDSYTIEVKQLASGQVNRSDEVSATQGQPAMSGQLSIKTDKGTFNLSLSSAGAATNKDAFAKFAEKINAAGAGVAAKTVEKDGKVSLELTGEGGFTVSGSMGERLGLNSVAQQGQEAVFTVRKNDGSEESLTSSGNKIEVDGLSIELKGTGSTDISSRNNGVDAMAEAIDKMVGSFNSTLKFLNQNSDVGIGVLSQMKRMVLPPTSERSMSKVGLEVTKDGSIKFDRDTFKEAMETNPSLTKDIVKNVANGIQSDARAGMQEKSFSLVGRGGENSSVYSAGQGSGSMESLSFLNAYNRNGVYSLMNLYAGGALLNISV